MKFDSPLPPEEKGVQWVTFEEAVKLNDKNPKPILFDMYTQWCGWCKKMDRDTYENRVIIDYLNEHYYPIKFDAEQKEDVEFGGKTYKYVPNGRRGYHELAATLMNGRMSYPTVVFLGSDYTVLQSVPGYKGAKDFERMIKFFGSGAYVDTKWEVYTADDSQFEIK